MRASPIGLSASRDEAERDRIRLALAATSGNVGRAAVALEVPRRTLDRRITALGLRVWLSTSYPSVNGRAPVPKKNRQAPAK